MSVASCDIAALRVSLHEVLDLVGRKHTISSGTGTYMGYSCFKQYVLALLLQGNIEFLENPDSNVSQYQQALQVIMLLPHHYVRALTRN
jgi:hypothetical protein